MLNETGKKRKEKRIQRKEIIFLTNERFYYVMKTNKTEFKFYMVQRNEGFKIKNKN